ncbi:unnamed protein product [Brassica rapa subsp. narinosa]
MYYFYFLYCIFTYYLFFFICIFIFYFFFQVFNNFLPLMWTPYGASKASFY